MTVSPGSSDLTAYSHGHQPSVLAAHATRTAQNSCAYFLDRIRPGQRILDIGCGPGSITLDLAELVGPQGRVTGTDFSAEAVTAARAAARDRGDATTEFIVGDLYDLDLQPASFDIVHAHQVLQHVPDPVGALAAMARYCKPGGLVVARDADYGAMAWYPEPAGLRRWHDSYCAGARSNGGEPFAGRHLRAWAHAAGLTVLVASSSMWTYASAESASWWGNSQADRVLTSSFALGAEKQGLTARDLEEIAADWRAWGADSDAWFFVPHGEMIATTSTP